MNLPKIIKTNVLYDHFDKKFIVDTYKADDGGTFDWAHLQGNGSCIIVSITSDQKILLVHQYRFNLETYTYENPAGSANADEDKLEAAKRELLEETGYESNNIVSLGHYYCMPGETNRWINIFLAKDITKKQEPLLDNDIEKYFDISLELISLAEAEQKMAGLEHLFALQLAKNYL